MRGLSVHVSGVYADGMFSRAGGAWLRLCPELPGAYALAPSSWDWRRQEAVMALCRRVFRHLREGSAFVR